MTRPSAPKWVAAAEAVKPTVAKMSLVITQRQVQRADPEQVERMLADLENFIVEGTPPE